MLLFDVRKVS